ncbi:MAG: hypothetical protein RLZZ304_864 [Actinomycetota bacterium]
MSENSVNRARFRLAPHQDQLAAEVKLGGGQQALAEVEAGTHALVYGAAGTGKTVGVRALALRIAREQGPAAVVAVAASREAANLLRDQLALQFQGSTPGPMARTVSSLAFSILRQAALDSGFVEPELVSGPEQDRILKELLAPYAVGRDSEFAGAEFIASAQSLAELGFPKFLSPQVVGLRGFRAELRDLIAVAQENQIDPDRLAELGEQHDLPIWVGAAHFYRLYVERLREPAYLNRHDSATLLNVASEYVQGLSDGDRIPAVLAGLKTVIVDDAQELTKGAIRLLRSLAERGIGLVLVGDPDASVLGFRASDPRAMRDLMNELGSGIQPIVLEARDQARGSTLNDVLLKVANKISPELAGPQRAALASAGTTACSEAEVDDVDPSPALEVRVHDTPASEAAWLANRLRQLHLHDGLAWRSIAVVARSREALRQFEAELAAENVPVLLAGARAALRDEYASRELLTLLRFALEPRELTLEQAVGFLTGPYCGLDSLGLRRLRRSLRRQELEGEGNRTADELILEMFAAPGAAVTLKTPEGFLVADFLKSIEATRIEAAERATVDRLLWTLWSASKARKAWVELSRGLGEVAVQANRNLDALVALFSVANRYVERSPEADALEFVAFQLDLELAEDTLSLNYRDDNRIQLLTPSALIGREFEAVVLVGMQEGSWPNLKARSSLLRATGLAELASARSTAPALASRTEIFDELRMLYKAIGVAKTRVLLSAVEGEESEVSQFVELVAGSIPESESFNEPALSLRSLVGELRRKLHSTKDAGARNEIHAALSLLAEQGVPGAAPAEWYGSRALSTIEPITNLAAGELVYISPSQFDKFLKCPLHWFMSSHGAREGGFEANLGTLLHKVLEEATDESESALNNAVESKWHTLDFESEWVERSQRKKAREMVSWLAGYLADKKADKIEAIAKEQKIKAEIGQAKISGNIDRIERSASGEIVIADLKTGASAPSQTSMDSENAQLALYQLAFEHGGALAIPGYQDGDRLVGATLIFPGAKKVLTQSSLNAEANPALQAMWLEKVQVAVRGMAMSDGFFLANIDSHCHDDNSYGDCKLFLTEAVSHAG